MNISSSAALISFLKTVDESETIRSVRENWKNILIVSFSCLLGFSFIAGFLSGFEDFVKCLFGGIFAIGGVALCIYLLTLTSALSTTLSGKEGLLKNQLSEVEVYLGRLEDLVQKFEKRLTELMAVLPKQAAMDYQTAKTFSVSLRKRIVKVEEFQNKGSIEGFDAALEILDLPLDIKLDSLSTVSSQVNLRPLEPEEWEKEFTALSDKLEEYLSQ